MKALKMAPALAGGLLGLCASIQPMPAQAGVRCNELGLSVCVEARTSGYTYGSIAWDDGTLTTLQPPDGSFTTASFPPWEYGGKTALYTGYGLNSTVSHSAPYGGLGPALQVDYAVNKGAGSVAPIDRTYTQGQLSNAFIHGQTGVLDPSLLLSGSSEAGIGVNRASAGLSGVVLGNFAVDAANVIRPGHTGTAHDHVLASGQSYWMETASFLPASAAGASTAVDFSVSLDGVLDAYGSGWYSLYATDHLGHVTPILGDTFIGSATPGAYARTLVGTLVAAAGETYTLSGDLVVYAQADGGGTSVIASEAFSHTARVTAIGLEAGATVAFGPNADNLRNVVQVSAVPEPSAWALMAAGLGVLALRARRRAGA